MHNITTLQTRPKPGDVDWMGGCPTCWRNDGHMNVGPNHWFFCRRHRVKWCAGSNLFSAWRDEPELEWSINDAHLALYREVAPVLPTGERSPLTEEEREWLNDIGDDIPF
jgi:hypothetical protein